MLSPQSLTENDRRLVAAWAADCAERVLSLFETEAPGDPRAREGTARARAFACGELDTAGEIRRRFLAGRAAHSATSPAGKAAAWAAGQAAELAVPHEGGAAEIAWQVEHMSQPVRAALRQLPLLGQDSSGPLGSGLLASGALGANIRSIQSALDASS